MLIPHMFKLQYVIIIGFSTWFRAFRAWWRPATRSKVDFAPDTDDATRSSFLRSCLDLFGGGADMDRKAIQIVWFWGCTRTNTHRYMYAYYIYTYIYTHNIYYIYICIYGPAFGGAPAPPPSWWWSLYDMSVIYIYIIYMCVCLRM